MDTGSAASLIHKRIVEQLPILQNNIIRIPKVNLVGINSKKLMDVNKAVVVQFNILDSSISMQLLIVDHIEFDVLIGSDELDKNEAIIDYEKETVSFKGIEIQFYKDGEEKEVQKTEECSMELTKETENIKLNNYEAKRYGYREENYKDKKYGYVNGIYEDKKYGYGYGNNGSRKNEIIINYINGMEINCDDGYRDDIMKLLVKYEGLVKEEARVAEEYVHKIKINKNIENFKSKTYPIPYKLRPQVNKAIEKLLFDNIIEYSNTSFINPIVIVQKKNPKDNIRICLDARNLNQCTTPEYESPQTIETILGRITNAKVYSQLDLLHSFWLIPLHPDSRKYTGFIINGVVYQFKVTPFGLNSSTSALLKALNKILHPYEDFTLHYVDDIVIFSNSYEQHLSKR